MSLEPPFLEVHPLIPEHGWWGSGGLLPAPPAAAQSLVLQLVFFHLCFWTLFTHISYQHVSFKNIPQTTKQLNPVFYMVSDKQKHTDTKNLIFQFLKEPDFQSTLDIIRLTFCNLKKILTNRKLYSKHNHHFRASHIVLRCATMRYVALRCVKLCCTTLRCITLGLLRYITWQTYLF